MPFLSSVYSTVFMIRLGNQTCVRQFGYASVEPLNPCWCQLQSDWFLFNSYWSPARNNVALGGPTFLLVSVGVLTNWGMSLHLNMCAGGCSEFSVALYFNQHENSSGISRTSALGDILRFCFSECVLWKFGLLYFSENTMNNFLLYPS